MNDFEAGASADGGCEPLTLRLAPALSEYLRREAARRSLEPAELAQRLLMRGLHQQRLDEVIRDLCPDCGATVPSSEAMLAARLEAGAVLGAFGNGTAKPAGAMPPSVRDASRTAIDRARRPRRH